MPVRSQRRPTCALKALLPKFCCSDNGSCCKWSARLRVHCCLLDAMFAYIGTVGNAMCGCVCRHALADLALRVAKNVMAQCSKRRAQVPIMDMPGNVVLPTLFYRLTSRTGSPLYHLYTCRVA